MTDSPAPTPSDEPDRHEVRREPKPGAPRWVSVSAIVLLVFVILLVVMLLVGGGNHGPGRHMSSIDKSSDAQIAAETSSGRVGGR
jgi:hypothetical protein